VIPLKGRKTQALVAYLALNPDQPRSREELVALLWGDRGEQQARSSLRQSLSELRKALGEADSSPLITGRDTVALDPGTVKVDAGEFERLINDGAPAALQEAAELYRGDFLDGIGIHNPAFENWLRDERQRLQARACEALSRLLSHQAEEDPEGALATARRLLALDPLREATHRALMRLYASQGERALALKQYHACRDILVVEFGVPPDFETERLAEEIRTGVKGSGDAITSEPGHPAPRSEPLPLPEKPSIAVLPFVNMSGDPEQEYFSAGITEDIITELARFDSLFVIAWNSSIHYKGQSPKIQDVGRELGVEYVVEGSVRRAANRVRITAQLVEAANGNHIWAERYDRELEDIFSVQDEVVREIVTAVPGQLDVAAIQRIRRRPADNLTAYEYLMRATHTRQQDWGSREAVVLLEKAIGADADCALAYANLANWHAYSTLAHGAPADEARQLTITFAEKAIHLDPNNSTILSMTGEAYLMSGDLELARQNIEKAIKLNPNNYNVMYFAGVVFAYLGDTEKAFRWTERILRHDPISIDAVRENYLEINYLSGRYEDAVLCFAKWPNPPRHVLAEAAAAYAQADRHEEAAKLRQEFEARSPQDYSFAKHLLAHLKMCALQEHKEMWIEGYRLAGFEV
jgi:TolB-like protein/Tfp pilus assembly protein PilF